MRVIVVTPPARFVSVEEAREHLRVDAGEDQLIGGMIDAASAHIDGPDGWLGRAIGVQMLTSYYHGFEGGAPVLPCPPVISIEDVAVRGDDGVWTSIPSADYELRGDRLYPVPGRFWPSVRWEMDRVRVRYQAGYETIPAPIRVAVLLMAGDLYRNRQESVIGTTATTVPMAASVAALLTPYRVYA